MFRFYNLIYTVDNGHWYINNVIDNHRGYIQLKLPGVHLQERGWQYFDGLDWDDDDTLSVSGRKSCIYM